jgi:S1-C subfamily serine protease
MGVSQKLTSGDVSSLSGLSDDPRLLQISAPVQSGNSGGPLLNMNGEVVGLISAKLSATQVLNKTGDLTQNVNYAVKARYVAGLLEDLSPQPTLQPGRFGKQPTLEDVAAGAKRAIFLIVAQ